MPAAETIVRWLGDEGWTLVRSEHQTDGTASEGYSTPPPGKVVEMRPVAVGRLVDLLSELPRDMPVVALYDCRSAGGSVVAVEVGPGPDGGSESALLIVE